MTSVLIVRQSSRGRSAGSVAVANRALRPACTVRPPSLLAGLADVGHHRIFHGQKDSYFFSPSERFGSYPAESQAGVLSEGAISGSCEAHRLLQMPAKVIARTTG